MNACSSLHPTHTGIGMGTSTPTRCLPTGKHPAMSAALPRATIPPEEGVETRLRLGTGKKPRMGARGQRKVKSGCQTCKIRHKRCNEARPACLQCSSTGRTCDFTTITTRPAVARSSHVVHEWRVVRRSLWHRPSSLPSHLCALDSFEASTFEYFRHVCARDFALYFESPWWGALVLRYALAEASIYHAALAISSMSRHNYYPTTTTTTTTTTSYVPEHHSCNHTHSQSHSAAEYCLAQYTLAIQRLNARLDSSVASVELAAFASILFIYIEGMQGSTRSMHVHLRGGLALVQSLLQLVTPNVGYLEWALWQIREQVQQIEAVRSNDQENPEGPAQHSQGF
ncbi:Fungal Zn2-Cys6 binuclear cluster domain-containing protein [Cladophialophora immunda]|nr:Fungal Zn2-Cys6 binuclear cluster domain-containing protein [Cladophialophora immunda]